MLFGPHGRGFKRTKVTLKERAKKRREQSRKRQFGTDVVLDYKRVARDDDFPRPNLISVHGAQKSLVPPPSLNHVFYTCEGEGRSELG